MASPRYVMRAILVCEEPVVSSENTAFPSSYPLGFLASTVAVCAVSCLGGLALLRWTFTQPLGEDFGAAFSALRDILTVLAPSLTFSVLGVFLAGSLGVSVVAVLASHRVAGPLFRMQHVAGDLGRGVLVGGVHLRASDHAKPVAAEINAWVSRRREERATLRGLAESLQEAGDRWAHARGAELGDGDLTEIRDRARKIVSVASDVSAFKP